MRVAEPLQRMPAVNGCFDQSKCEGCLGGSRSVLNFGKITPSTQDSPKPGLVYAVESFTKDDRCGSAAALSTARRSDVRFSSSAPPLPRTLRRIPTPSSGFVAKRCSRGHDSLMIVQILKVFDISAIFEEESWLPTDLTLGAAYLPAQQRRCAMQA